MTQRRAVFLDRDGTLNREQGFVTRPEDLVVLRGVGASLERLRRAGFATPVLTNQSGVARGLSTQADLERVNDRLRAQLPGLLDAIYSCPHHPEGTVAAFAIHCECRKPAPGLLLRAARELDLALAGSFVVGDSARDVLMARGLPLVTILVRSGKDPAVEMDKLAAAGCVPDHVADDLAAATGWILERAATLRP